MTYASFGGKADGHDTPHGRYPLRYRSFPAGAGPDPGRRGDGPDGSDRGAGRERCHRAGLAGHRRQLRRSRRVDGHEHWSHHDQRRSRAEPGDRHNRISSRRRQRDHRCGRQCRSTGPERPDRRVHRRRGQPGHGYHPGGTRRDHRDSGRVRLPRGHIRDHRNADPRCSGRPERRVHLSGRIHAHHGVGQQRGTRQRRTGVQRLLGGRQFRDPRHLLRPAGKRHGHGLDHGHHRSHPGRPGASPYRRGHPGL